MRSVHYSCILRVFAWLLWLATALPAFAAQRYLTRSWQSEDGLPSNVARVLAQAADGYLWIGTPEGVVRFDGQRFTGFPSDTALARRSIRSLFALANGEVWVTTPSGQLMRGKGAHLHDVALPPSSEDPPVIAISQVFLGDHGDVIAVRGTEIWKVSGRAPEIVAQPDAALKELLQKNAAAEAESGRPIPGERGARLRGRGGELWSYSSGKGLTITDAAGIEQRVALPLELSAIVQGMLEDREGNIWLATRAQGLWRLRPSRVDVLTIEDGLSDRTTQLVCEDRAGGLWVAPLPGGLDRLATDSVKRFDVTPPPLRRTISAMLETRAGVFWAATSEAQVYNLNNDAFGLAFPRERGPGKVMAMAEDDQGRIWFGGRYGLSYWDGGETRPIINLGGAEVVTSLVSVGRAILAGTESGRVFRGTGERFEAIASEDAFWRQPVSSLLPETDGCLWIGTMGGGLFYYDGARVTPCAQRMREADPRITCVLADSDGFLWLGTLSGICRVEKRKLLNPSAVGASSTLILDRSDGLLTRECTRGGQPAGWRGNDGTLYFATGNGIARVRPEKLALNAVAPPVVIEEASEGGRSLAPVTHRLQAGPGRSRLEFRYTALTFTAPEKVHFRTRLEGLDETWRDAGNQRSAAYEAVPPGRYRFQVIAENGDGVWNEVGAALAVEVLPHFWETRGFQVGLAVLAAALAVAGGALVMRARLRGRLLRLEAQTSREKERARIAQDLHDDLGASLTEISLLANLAAEDRGPAKSGDETLPEVAAKAQALVGALDEIVWAVNPRHDTLRSLAEYLAAFGEKFLRSAGIKLRRDVPRDLPDANLDAERRHNVFLATREALNNVVKHSGASEVWLRIRLEGRELILSIEDNGRGFSTEADELSEGLRGMRNRMSRIGGECRVESDSSGARVRLSLPFSVEKRNGTSR